jgi:ADP-ribosylglycohydrolase
LYRGIAIGDALPMSMERKSDEEAKKKQIKKIDGKSGYLKPGAGFQISVGCIQPWIGFLL